MTAIPVPDELAERLARRARRDGVPQQELVNPAIRGFLDQAPYEFLEAGSSGDLRRDSVDERLAETGFGQARS